MIISLFVSCSGGRKVTKDTSGMTKKERIAQDSIMLRNLLESGSFEFSVSRVTGQTYSISSGYYFLRIDNGNAEAYLPFFGESKRYDFSGEGGIVFAAPMTEYRAEYNSRKKFYAISFNIYDPKDQYQVYLDIYNLSMATLRVSSANKSPMAYTGVLGEINRPKPRIKKR